MEKNSIKISPTPKTMLKRQIFSETRKAAEIAAPIFSDHKWDWAGVEGIPTEIDIRQALQAKIEDLLRDDELTFISSGRLRVQRDDWGDGDQSLFLLLELSEIYLDRSS